MAITYDLINALDVQQSVHAKREIINSSSPLDLTILLVIACHLLLNNYLPVHRMCSIVRSKLHI